MEKQFNALPRAIKMVSSPILSRFPTLLWNLSSIGFTTCIFICILESHWIGLLSSAYSKYVHMLDMPGLQNSWASRVYSSKHFHILPAHQRPVNHLVSLITAMPLLCSNFLSITIKSLWPDVSQKLTEEEPFTLARGSWNTVHHGSKSIVVEMP